MPGVQHFAPRCRTAAMTRYAARARRLFSRWRRYWTMGRQLFPISLGSGCTERAPCRWASVQTAVSGSALHGRPPGKPTGLFRSRWARLSISMAEGCLRQAARRFFGARLVLRSAVRTQLVGILFPAYLDPPMAPSGARFRPPLYNRLRQWRVARSGADSNSSIGTSGRACAKRSKRTCRRILATAS